jgi:hypothetical protein
MCLFFPLIYGRKQGQMPESVLLAIERERECECDCILLFLVFCFLLPMPFFYSMMTLKLKLIFNDNKVLKNLKDLV